MSNFNNQTRNALDNEGRVWTYRAIEKKEKLNEWQPISEQNWENFVDGLLKTESLLTPKNIILISTIVFGFLYVMYLLMAG